MPKKSWGGGAVAKPDWSIDVQKTGTDINASIIKNWKSDDEWQYKKKFANFHKEN